MQSILQPLKEWRLYAAILTVPFFTLIVIAFVWLTATIMISTALVPVVTVVLGLAPIFFVSDYQYLNVLIPLLGLLIILGVPLHLVLRKLGVLTSYAYVVFGSTVGLGYVLLIEKTGHISPWLTAFIAAIIIGTMFGMFGFIANEKLLTQKRKASRIN